MRFGDLLQMFAPMLILNHDKSTSPDFPAMPNIATFLCLHAFYRANAVCWQFATFNRQGRVQAYTPSNEVRSRHSLWRGPVLKGNRRSQLMTAMTGVSNPIATVDAHNVACGKQNPIDEDRGTNTGRRVGETGAMSSNSASAWSVAR
jgi:hypothetical protein